MGVRIHIRCLNEGGDVAFQAEDTGRSYDACGVIILHGDAGPATYRYKTTRIDHEKQEMTMIYDFVQHRIIEV